MPLPRSLAEFNRRYTNKVSRHIAGWLPGFGIVVHTGRRTGRTYETPVNVFRADDGFVFALTYGRAEWVQNVIAAGSARLRTNRTVHDITNPRIVAAPDHEDLPFVARTILPWIHVDEEMRVESLRVEDR
jgi:deazaflavin-dependent oxidoreductase (nitroreductase family)